MIGRGDDDRIDRLVLKHPAEVPILRDTSAEKSRARFQTGAIRVRDANKLHVRLGLEIRGVGPPDQTEANQAYSDPFVGAENTGPRSRCQGGGFRRPRRRTLDWLCLALDVIMSWCLMAFGAAPSSERQGCCRSWLVCCANLPDGASSELIQFSIPDPPGWLAVS